MNTTLEPQSNHELTVELFEKGQFFSKLTFKKSEIIIGRQPENDIQIPDKAVSRQHAKIIIENNEVKLVDLGSANGTYVDNQKITVQKVNSSSMIRIGQQILRLTLETTVQKNGKKVAQIVEEPEEEHELTLSIIVKNIEESFEENKHLDHPENISLVDSDFVQQLTQSYIVQGSRQFTGFKLESLVLWNDRIYSMNEFNQKEKIDVGPVKQNAIHIPSLSQQWTLINYDFAEARFIVPQTYPIYVLRGKNFLSQEHLQREKRIKTDVKSLEVIASAYDVVRIDIDEMTRLYVRYIPTSTDLERKKLMSPDEFVKKAFKFSFVFHLILAVIIMLIPAEKLKEKEVKKSVEHTARIIVEEKPKEIPAPVIPPPEPPKPIVEEKKPDPPKEKPPEPPKEKPPVVVKQKPKPKKLPPPPVIVQKVKQPPPPPVQQERPAAAPVAKQPAPVQQVEKPSPAPVVAAPAPVPQPPAPPPPPPKKVDVNQLGALAALGNMKLDTNSKNALPPDIKINQASDKQAASGTVAGLNTSALTKDIKADAQSSAGANHSGPILTKGKGSNKTGYGQEGIGSETGQRGVKGAVLGKPALKFESASKLEGLTREQVMKTMQGAMSKIQNCYERALLSDEGLAGRIEFEWEIAASGSVSGVEIKKNSVAGGEQLGECVVQVIQKIQFPKATNGETTRPSIGFPFGRL